VHRDIPAAFLRWTFLRAALWRGYWTVTAVYLVVVAELTPAQLVVIGTFQGLTNVLAEVPAGVLADTVSRRFALVVSHVVRGAGMVLAGSVTAFPLLVASQCLCGLGWAFSSGADVAWLSDELEDPAEVDAVLAARARWELLGEPAGIVVIGLLAWATTLATAIVASGVAMALVAAAVAGWPERGFVPAAAGTRWREAGSVLRRGLRLARVDRVVLAVVVATALVDGGSEVFGRLRERELLARGLPTEPDPIVWFGAVAVVGIATGAIVLRVVEARIAGAGVAQRTYVLACTATAAGLVLFAHAPNVAAALLATMVVSGIAGPLSRAAATIWVNQRATRDVRATVHSMVSQAEHAGELVFGLALAGVAGATSASTALVGSAGLVATAAVVARRATRAPSPARRRRSGPGTPAGRRGRRGRRRRCGCTTAAPGPR
jgi:hypothetical protein